MDIVHYNVTGLINNSTKTQIKNALDKIDGIQEVCVDLGRSSIEVAFNESVTEAEVRNCIEETGFSIE
ncbi:heavy-metal-associated domain-containing protein [Clostridium sp. NSJ-49]|uniref:Heavy metal-binding domain-containing protein n=1 Tax=Clostridium disporicum TaxID=84024 RepID=A0A174KZM4_9CLOT|nr:MULTISPECIES: heavy metal-associated domain-containing protein [Clostridium]MBC5627080.1 heavy-metal-associated domain-containing protein [Clostridium sp. NSJ-49]MDU6341030.1 heavy metal-associated domain-containing protein [Clostridium sp.]CUP14975.1 heavy metal-binding domain-containing protein [Clostridium disporicum]